MKKFIFSLLTILTFQTVMSQDIKKVRSAYEKKDWTKAKDAVDLYLATEKGTKDWEGWYYKGLIYAQVAKSPIDQTNDNKPRTLDQERKFDPILNAWTVSFEAFKKASQLDAKQVTAFMAVRDYPVFENYQGLYQNGYDLYAKNDFRNAVINFKQADQVGRYIYENKWALSELDTALVFIIGYTYLVDKKPEQSVTYFKQIADREITGKDYDICYSSLAYYYDNIGDRVNSEKYANLGRRLYPEDPYYDKLDIERESKNGIGPNLFLLYEKVIEKTPNDIDIVYEYASNMVKWLYPDNQESAEVRQKTFINIINQLNTCIKLNDAYINAYTLKGETYYKEAAELEYSYNKIKGTAPADLDKKKAIKTNMDSYINECIKSFEGAVVLFEKMPTDDFKNDELLKKVIGYLKECYKYLGNKEKAQYYEKKEQALQ